MADYDGDYDRDDYGEDDNQEQQVSVTASDDLHANFNDIKGEEDSDSKSDGSESSSNSDSGDSNNEPYTVDLLDEGKPVFATANQLRITNPYISKYEKASIIGKRADQISKNSPIYVEIDWSKK